MYQPPQHGGAALYSSPKDDSADAERNVQTPPARRLLSVRAQTNIGASLIVLLFLTVSAVNLGLAKIYYQPQDDKGLAARQQGKAQLIESRLSYLQQLIEEVARQPSTQDLLITDDVAGAQRWALQMRRFLPQAIGVALLAPDTRVLGEPPGQHIGPLCLTDLAQLSEGLHIPSPPVHLDDTQTAHFDITAPVLDDTDKPIGLLFVSFAVDSLQDLLRNNSNPNQHFVLRDGHGKVFAQWGQLADGATPLSINRSLSGSDWQLQLSEPNPGITSPSFVSLVIFNVSAFLLIVGCVAWLVGRHTRRIQHDFRQVREHIEQLADGQAQAAAPTPSLGEAAHILPALSNIRQNIDRHQQQLARQNRTDALTGLANRRQFNREFSRAYDFARRNLPVCVVLIRMEGLHELTQKEATHSIKLLARALLQSSRKIDITARLSDEQFALLLFNVQRAGIEASLQRLQDSFRSQQLKHADIPNHKVCTLYCGYTLIQRHRDNDPGQILVRAENALQAASREQPIVGA